ncbi:MAG TPA: hypothetical protein QF772_04045, partial [Nitrospinaceae bacterium]|nr:hypothetical protein [Nitrospinaceae bacterium]
ILTSEGLIASSRGQINFFHESFFDHVYARTFVNRGHSLLNFLTETEQHLFRRTQVRQILEALRQNDFERYIIEISSVLSSNDIRFHIKTAISQWLNSIDEPNEQEFVIISPFNEPSGKFYQFFHNAVLSTHAWFDFLNEKGWIRQQITGDNQERSEGVLWWLSIIAGERPTEIANLLRSWWGGDTERAERLLDWFGFLSRSRLDNDLLQLCEDVINSHPSDMFTNKGSDRIMTMLHGWGEKSPNLCGQVLHSLFEAWFALNPGRILFERDELKAIDIHSFAEFEKKSPQAFLKGTTDAIVRSIDMVIAEGKTGKNWYSFSHRTYSGSRFGFDNFLGMYRSSLKKVAGASPEEMINSLDKLGPHKHECLMHLHLEVIQANPIEFGNRLPSLVTNEMIFDAGWHGADWLSFAEACKAALPYLSVGKKKVLEK